MPDYNDNGKEDFKGPLVTLDQLMRQDGMLAQSIDKAHKQNSGVILSVLTAEEDDKHYRQILKHGRWKSIEEMDKAVNALHLCKKVGAKDAFEVVLDKITARASGLNGELIREAFDALTHTTHTTRTFLDKFKRREHDPDRSASPLN